MYKLLLTAILMGNALFCFSTSVYAQQDRKILKKIQFNTYLSHLDNEVALKCSQGNPDQLSYSTSSTLELHSMTLRTPSENHTNFQTQNMNQGTPCRELIREFNSHKNSYGTIPVTVTITVFPGASYESYSLTKIDGSNVGSRISTQNYIHETIEFDVGPLHFSSFNSFAILKKVADRDILDLTPNK